MAHTTASAQPWPQGRRPRHPEESGCEGGRPCLLGLGAGALLENQHKQMQGSGARRRVEGGRWMGHGRRCKRASSCVSSGHFTLPPRHLSKALAQTETSLAWYMLDHMH